jgi:hypothetical protein
MISCHNKSDTPVIDTNENEILNLALNKVIGSDTSWRYHLKLPPPIPIIAFTHKIDSAEYLKTIRWRDSAQKILDTASIFVVVYKENEEIAESYIDNIKNQIVNNHNDTLFNETLQLLCNQNLSKDTINIALLKPKANFKIFNVGMVPDDRLRNIGSLRFSKIAFNKIKDKACIYTRFSCGELCGSGDIHFFAKKDGKWTYIKSWELWVS